MKTIITKRQLLGFQKLLFHNEKFILKTPFSKIIHFQFKGYSAVICVQNFNLNIFLKKKNYFSLKTLPNSLQEFSVIITNRNIYVSVDKHSYMHVRATGSTQIHLSEIHLNCPSIPPTYIT